VKIVGGLEGYMSEKNINNWEMIRGSAQQ